MTEPKFDLDVVLSLFDGISCGQESLRKAGISTRIYLASEIEKYPKQITRKNHPLTVQLGDVTKVVADDLPHVNLLMGGSPCQGFSFAGKQLNFDDPRSALFFEFVRLLKECKPDYFLLENVMMKQEYQDVITEHLGVEPVMINSALVSAQNRKRLYWTNIPGVGQPNNLQINLTDVLEDIPVDKPLKKYMTGDFNGVKRIDTKTYNFTTQDKSLTLTAGSAHDNKILIKKPITQPEDKGILLKDVLEESPEDYTLMSDRFVNRNKDAGCLVNSDKPKASSLSAMEYVKNGRQGDYILCVNPKKEDGTQTYQQDRVYSAEGKMVALSATLGGRFYVEEPICGRIVGRKINPETGKRDDYNPELKRKKRIEARLDEKSGTLTTVQTDNVLIVPEATKKGYTEIKDGDCFDATFINSKTRRGRNMKDKSNCLTAANYDYMRYEHPTYRKLTPIECERLQTLPDNYTEGVSNTQRYKALGNGWTVDVIVHILQGLKQQTKVVAA